MNTYKVPVSYEIEVQVLGGGLYKAPGYSAVRVEVASMDAVGDSASPQWRATCQAIVDLHERLTRESWKDAKPGEHYMVAVDGGEPEEYVVLQGRGELALYAISYTACLFPWSSAKDSASITSCVKVER